MHETTTIIACALALALVTGCKKSNGGDQDTSVVTDTMDDTAQDTATDTAQDMATEDTADDTLEEPESPATCAGPDSITLEFLHPDESPVAGIPVALKCLDQVRTAPSGPDGRVTFANLDLESIPVDFTFVDGGAAYSLVGVGGMRAVPDPFTFYVEDPEAPVDPDPVLMTGDIIRSVADSWVAIATTAPHWLEIEEDRYEIYTVDATGLTLVAIEYTSTGDQALPLGYLMVGYDTPDAGTDGPTLDFTSPDGTLDDADLTLTYDLAAGSPLSTILKPSDEASPPTRLDTGMRIIGYDASGDFLMYGFTTGWTGDFSTDTLEVAYIDAGLAASTSIAGELIFEDPGRAFIYVHNLTTDPSTWTTLAIHDLPGLPGFSVSTPVTFATEIQVVFPGWTGAAMQYHIRLDGYWGVLSYADELRWNVTVHPETTSFSFGELPWPESVPIRDVLAPGSYHFGATSAHYTDDPYVDYRIWDDDWADASWIGFATDSRYRMATP